MKLLKLKNVAPILIAFLMFMGSFNKVLNSNEEAFKLKSKLAAIETTVFNCTRTKITLDWISAHAFFVVLIYGLTESLSTFMFLFYKDCARRKPYIGLLHIFLVLDILIWHQPGVEQ